MREIEELNREFSRCHRETTAQAGIDQEFIQACQGRELDQWYETINAIYWSCNFYRDSMSIFTHLAEVIGGLSLLASDKEKKWITPEDFISKAIAWWLALCGKVNIRSVSEMLWAKFPGVCPYCLQCPHAAYDCADRKAKREGPDWETLASMADRERGRRPGRLGDWQKMFSIIYQVQQTEGYGPSFARLTEELGELAEALRVFPAVPGYFLSEAADVFAWLMHIQNLIEFKRKLPKEDYGKQIEVAFCRAYPDRCINCGANKCQCPPILDSTVGRIGHEVPTVHGSFDFRQNFMTPDETLLRFQLSRST